ncbi:MAG: hypothetical protein HC929_09760 [Leptolyngbyaceae cyanobacterium SM2_5_2]|nr:hypothetical protein [Leptolyngbyaceae cyanobacterium SM2_5_2]
MDSGDIIAGVSWRVVCGGPSFSSLQGVATGGEALDQTARRVPLIELSPEEQSRLPDFSSSAYSLLPGDNGDIFELFPPSGDSVSSLPLNPGSGFSSLPKVSSSSPSFGSPPLSVSPFPSSLGRRIVIPVAPRNPGAAQSPPAGNPSTPPDRQETPDNRASTPTSGDVKPSDQPSAEDLALSPDNSQPAENSPEPGNANSGQTTPATRSQDLIARVEYSPELTTLAEAETAKAAWLEAIEEQLGQPATEMAEPLSVEVPYNLRICLAPEPTDGLLGLVVLPGEEANTVELSTAVLKSTGYVFLNQEAEQILQTKLVEAELPLGIGQIYQAMVKVNYDAENCIDRNALLKSRVAEPQAEPNGSE